MNLPDLGLAYLASPYSLFEGGIDAAHSAVCKIAAHLIMGGAAIYCPIAASHEIARIGNLDPLDHKLWMPFNQKFMIVCDTLIVANMEGWRDSYGIGEEVKFFTAAGKPIYDLDPPTLLMMRRKTSGIPRLEELRSILTCKIPAPVPPPPMTVERALARIAELDFQISTAPGWGAAVGAMNEERKELIGFIAREHNRLLDGVEHNGKPGETSA